MDKPLRAVVGSKYTYTRPALSMFALDGVDSGTVVVACKGPGVGRAPNPWVYVADEQGRFLGMTTVGCLSRRAR